jgi:hypothetical protein
MLAAVRSRVWGRGKESVAAREEPAARPKTRARSPEDSLLLLVPSEGGMAFRLYSVENEAEAEAFLQREFPRLGGKSLAFWPLKTKPQASAGQSAEALVLISDPARPGTVYLSSFETMEDAESFTRFEIENGLDRDLITTYWGVPKTIEAIPQGHLSLDQSANVAASATVQAQPVVPPAVARASTAMPARAVAVPTARQSAPVRTAPGAQAAAVDAARPGLLESMRAWPGWDTLRERVTAAAMLKWEVYEDVKKDPIASTQARVIVATGAAAAGIGAFWAGPLAIITYVAAGLLGWLAFAYVTYLVGTTVFPGQKSDQHWALLFKALGIAHAPRILILSGIALPLFAPLIALALFIWLLAAAVPATQYSLELDRESAILSTITGALALFAISLMIPALII